MSEQIILQQLPLLPENLKQEVIDFIGYLITKHQKQSINATQKTPKFGSAKGKYVLSSDFNAPLEDFKEYM